MSLRQALGEHWPEYLIEGWALGCLMISIGVFVTVLESPELPVVAVLPNGMLRAVMLASVVGATVTGLIHCPWGKRSGAHMNPAVTLAFLRLKQVHPYDALFYVLAQMAGGILGVVALVIAWGHFFTDLPVRYAITVPGPAGNCAAFMSELVTSFVLMTIILSFNASARFARYTGLAVGCAIALSIVTSAPLSGASMNPARTLASAVPAGLWQHIWIYLPAPTLGMLIAAQRQRHSQANNPAACAKMLHSREVRCIHCSYRPRFQVADNVRRDCATWTSHRLPSTRNGDTTDYRPELRCSNSAAEALRERGWQ